MCGRAVRPDRPPQTSLSGHVHVLLDLKEHLREKKDKPRKTRRHTGEKANLCPGMAKICRKGLIDLLLWLSQLQWSESGEVTAEQRLGEKT